MLANQVKRIYLDRSDESLSRSLNSWEKVGVIPGTSADKIRHQHVTAIREIFEERAING